MYYGFFQIAININTNAVVLEISIYFLKEKCHGNLKQQKS